MKNNVDTLTKIKLNTTQITMRNKKWILFQTLLFLPVLMFSQQGLHFEKYTLGEGITATGDDGAYSINLRGFIQAQSDTKFYEGDTSEDNNSRFRLRRARLRLSGDAFNKKISYRFTADFAASLGGNDDANSTLMDAFVTYSPTSNLDFTFGQKGVETDPREMGIGSNALAFTDRSKLSSAFSTIREVGVFASGTFRIGKNSFVRPTLLVTDGDGSFTSGKRYGGLKYGARINYLPFGKFREFGEYREPDLVKELSPKLSIGAAFSYNDGTSDRRGGRNTGDILYLDKDNNPDLPSYSKFLIDFLFKYRGLSILGEYVNTWADVPSSIVYRVRTDGTTATTFDGGLDAYVKGRMILGEAYNIEASYLLPKLFLVGFRYTHLEPDLNSYLTNTLYFNRNNYYEISAAKFLTRSNSIKIQASYIFVDAGPGSRDVYSNEMKGNENMLQVLMQISF